MLVVRWQVNPREGRLNSREREFPWQWEMATTEEVLTTVYTVHHELQGTTREQIELHYHKRGTVTGKDRRQQEKL